jgi:hypothetical protein
MNKKADIWKLDNDKFTYEIINIGSDENEPWQAGVSVKTGM